MASTPEQDADKTAEQALRPPDELDMLERDLIAARQIEQDEALGELMDIFEELADHQTAEPPTV